MGLQGVHVLEFLGTTIDINQKSGRGRGETESGGKRARVETYSR